MDLQSSWSYLKDGKSVPFEMDMNMQDIADIQNGGLEVGSYIQYKDGNFVYKHEDNHARSYHLVFGALITEGSSFKKPLALAPFNSGNSAPIEKIPNTDPIEFCADAYICVPHNGKIKRVVVQVGIPTEVRFAIYAIPRNHFSPVSTLLATTATTTDQIFINLDIDVVEETRLYCVVQGGQISSYTKITLYITDE